MSYFLAFLGFALLIILHEAGHFAAAKAVGMRVERFSLFFGPMVFKRRRGETEYGVGVIPLGGYVKITGMSPSEEFETPEIEARAYYNQPAWKRIVVIAAGPAVNILIAFVLVWGLEMFSIAHYGPTTNTIAEVFAHEPATGRLQPGDKLVSVDGVKGSPARLHQQISGHHCAGKQVNGCPAQTPARIVVSRDGVLHTYEIRPRYESKYHELLVGFGFLTPKLAATPITAMGESVSGLWRASTATVSRIVQIFKPKDRAQLHSVLGAYTYTQQSFASGGTTALEILALISLSLGIINLFPFLPLDGGHIFWAVVEKVRGKRVPWIVMERAGIVGVALILGLFLIGLSNDISGLANGTLNVH